MAGSSSTTTNASRSRKRVEAAVLKRAHDGSAFTRCEACNKTVPVVLIDLHSCSLDSNIRINLESQVVEKAVQIPKTDKRKAPSAGKKGKPAPPQGPAKKGKRPQSAFFLFMKDFREEFKVTHPDEKGVVAVGKAGGEKWRSMTDEEKKPYFDQAEELKAQLLDKDNAEGSANNVAEENNVAEAEEEVEQEVAQPANPEDDVVEEAEEKNELDDDISISLLCEETLLLSSLNLNDSTSRQ